MRNKLLILVLVSVLLFGCLEQEYYCQSTGQKVSDPQLCTQSIPIVNESSSTPSTLPSTQPTASIEPIEWTENEQCHGLTGFTCIDYTVYEDNKILLTIGNKIGRTVIVYCEGEKKEATTTEPISCQITGTASGPNQIDFTLEYHDPLTDLEHADNGYIAISTDLMNCMDSDGNDPYTSGSCSPAFGGTYYDECTTTQYGDVGVMEYTCKGTVCQPYTIACEEGYCYEGACQTTYIFTPQPTQTPSAPPVCNKILSVKISIFDDNEQLISTDTGSCTTSSVCDISMVLTGITVKFNSAPLCDSNCQITGEVNVLIMSGGEVVANKPQMSAGDEVTLPNGVNMILDDVLTNSYCELSG